MAPSPHPFRLLVVILVAWALSACDIINTGDRLLNPADKRISDYQLLSPAMGWASVPGQLAVMQRTIGNETEQVILLPNATAIPGDNRMILRASRRWGEGPGRLRVEALRSRIGGFPAPFQGLDAGSMTTATDGLGPYSYALQTFGDINCVLAVRKANGADRLIPAKRNALDAVLRNCVLGSAEEALMPIRDTSFGYAGFTGPRGASGTRLLSPLAGPLPD